MANSALALSVMNPAVRAPRSSVGLLSALLAAFRAARRQDAEKAVAEYIQLNGGRLTDELEREISRKFGDFVG